MVSARDQAVKALLGRKPSGRWKPKTVLGRLTELFPAYMHSIADHAGLRFEESGGESCSAGRRLAITMEAELLALRTILLARVLDEGVITEDNEEHKHLKSVLRITDQVSRLVNLIGLDPPPKESSSPVDVSELWGDLSRAAKKPTVKPREPSETQGAGSSDTESEGRPAPGQGEPRERKETGSTNVADTTPSEPTSDEHGQPTKEDDNE